MWRVVEAIGTIGMGPNPYTKKSGVNCQVYIVLLVNNLILAARGLFPAHLQRSWIWQQDGARPHRATATLQKLNAMPQGVHLQCKGGGRNTS